MTNIKKFFYIIIGLIAFLLGAIGVVLPVLPTTPFLLLASFCFVRGSEKFDKWFKSTKTYKKHLESFVESRSMTMKQKVSLVLFADFMMLIPFIMVDNIHMRMTLIMVALIKLYYFIFKIKTIKPNSATNSATN